MTPVLDSIPSVHPLAREQIARSPLTPGVYLFKNEAGKVLYVGKAKKLRHRLKSYLNPHRDDRPSVLLLVPQIHQVEWLLTDNEKEALLLENSLIKSHAPRYNIMLRDDKSYVSLRLTRHEFPRLFVTRKIVKDGSHYFGPYSSASDLRQTLKLIQKLFQIRDCSDSYYENRTRPCLQFQIKRCTAPCVGRVGAKEYGEQVRQAGLFLEGSKDELLERLEAEMAAASERLAYEEAARARDRLRAVRETLEPQRIEQRGRGEDSDAVGLSGDDEATLIKILKIRDDRIVSAQELFVDEPLAASVEIVRALLQQIYLGSDLDRDVPARVFVPVEIPDARGFEALLTEARGTRVHVLRPRRGKGLRFLRLAERNALSALAERKRRSDRTRMVLDDLQRVLRLPGFPKRVEGYDISAFHGAEPVGSMVVFVDGEPDKSQYRHYGIRSVKGSNDFAMLHEMFERRFARLTDENRPDLVLVDGGKGQLQQVVMVLKEIGANVPVVSIAKERELRSRSGKRYAPERIFFPGQKNPLVFPPSSPLLHFLQRIRDESHRFGITHHRKARGKTLLKSLLSRVPGVGPKRQRGLLRAFPDLESIRLAPIEELQAKAHLPEAAARAVQKFLRAQVNGGDE